MLIKTLIIILFMFILFNLGAGLFHMMKDKGQSQKMVRSLTWRVALSILAFILLLLAAAAGFIQPHGVIPG